MIKTDVVETFSQNCNEVLIELEKTNGVETKLVVYTNQAIFSLYKSNVVKSFMFAMSNLLQEVKK